MPRRPDFEPYQQGERWIVNVPPAMSADGRRHRKSFTGEEAANRFAGKLRASHGSGVRGAMIPATLALQAMEAARILEGSGVSLIEAAKQAARRAAEAGPRETFKKRLDRALLANEERWSAVYAQDIGNLWRHLPAWFMQTDCREITAEVIEQAITEGRNLKRSSIDHRARYVRAVIGHKERHRRSDTPDLMTDGQIDKLIEVGKTPEEKRCVAVLLFAGIRPDSQRGEISRLGWQAFGKTEIYVSQEVSKVGDRFIPITPRLRRLIKGHPASEPVAPSNWKKVWQRLRRDAGISNLQDATRHAFCSHALAAWGMEKTQAAMGHVPLSAVTRANYTRAVTKAAGLAYFR